MHADMKMLIKLITSDDINSDNVLNKISPKVMLLLSTHNNKSIDLFCEQLK